MKTFVFWEGKHGWICLLAMLVLGTVGCSRKDEQQTAAESIQQSGYEVTPDDFVKAAGSGNLNLLKTFLEVGVNPAVRDSQGQNAMMVAIPGGHVEVVEWLLSQKKTQTSLRSDPTPAGDTPLHLATLVPGEKGGKILDLLLKAGADPTQKNSKGFTPMMNAVWGGNLRAVEVLAPKVKDEIDTALHLAAVNGDTAVIEVLIHHGANLFSRSRENKTALMYAATNGHLEVVRLLLGRGANPLATDPQNRTAADMALEVGKREVAEFLSDPKEVEEARRGAATPPVHGRLNGVEIVHTPSAEGMDEGVVLGEGDGEERGAGASQPLASGSVSVSGAASANGKVRSSVDSAQGNGPNAGEPGSFSEGSAESGVGGSGPNSSGLSSTNPGSVAAGGTQNMQGVPRSNPVKGTAGGVTPRPRNTRSQTPLLLEDFREVTLPVMVTQVPAQNQVTFRRLDTGEDGIKVSSGDRIPGTRLRLVSAQRKSVTTKLSQGEWVDVSEATVEDVETGERHRLVNQVPAQGSDTYALLRDPATGRLYDARPGDQFSIQTDRGMKKYEVLEVRPNQVLLLDDETKDTLVVPKATREELMGG